LLITKVKEASRTGRGLRRTHLTAAASSQRFGGTQFLKIECSVNIWPFNLSNKDPKLKTKSA